MKKQMKVEVYGMRVRMERGIVEAFNINIDTVAMLKDTKARVNFFLGLQGRRVIDGVEYAVNTSVEGNPKGKQYVTLQLNEVVSTIETIEARVFTIDEIKAHYNKDLVKDAHINWIEDIAQHNKAKVLVDSISKIAYDNSIAIVEDITSLSIKELVKIFHVIRYRLASSGQIEKIDNNMLSLANTNFNAYQKVLSVGKNMTIEFASSVIDFLNTDSRVKVDKGTVYKNKEYFNVVDWSRFGLKDNYEYFTSKGFDYTAWETDMMKFISHAQFAQIISDNKVNLTNYMRNRPTKTEVKQLHELYTKLGYHMNYFVIASKTREMIARETKQLQYELQWSIQQKYTNEFTQIIKETDFLGATKHQEREYIERQKEDNFSKIYRELERLARTIAVASDCSRDDEFINDMLSRPEELREAYRGLVRDKKMSLSVISNQIEEISHFLAGITDSPFEQM